MVEDAFFAGGFAVEGDVLEDECRADEGEEAGEFGEEGEGFGLGCAVAAHPDWTWTSGREIDDYRLLTLLCFDSYAVQNFREERVSAFMSCCPFKRVYLSLEMRYYDRIGRYHTTYTICSSLISKFKGLASGMGFIISDMKIMLSVWYGTYYLCDLWIVPFD